MYVPTGHNIMFTVGNNNWCFRTSNDLILPVFVAACSLKLIDLNSCSSSMFVFSDNSLAEITLKI